MHAYSCLYMSMDEVGNEDNRELWVVRDCEIVKAGGGNRPPNISLTSYIC